VQNSHLNAMSFLFQRKLKTASAPVEIGLVILRVNWLQTKPMRPLLRDSNWPIYWWIVIEARVFAESLGIAKFLPCCCSSSFKGKGVNMSHTGVDSWTAALYKLGSDSWLAWASGKVRWDGQPGNHTFRLSSRHNISPCSATLHECQMKCMYVCMFISL